jgi:Uma2 family endonuclease
MTEAITTPEEKVAEKATDELALTPEDLPKVDHLVTEDDTPVDNWFSEKQMRLLTRPLYASWAGAENGRKFVVAANVGLYASVHDDPLVPDVMLSLDVELPEDWWEKGHRVYFFWLFGKSPDVVLEIVSNRSGGELGAKMARYARMGIPYYAIYDPERHIQDEPLQLFELSPQRRYAPRDPARLPGIGLGLKIWQGAFEGREDSWLRWHDEEGNLILTGDERAREADQRAEQERQRAERAEAKAARLAARLQALGIELDDDEE